MARTFTDEELRWASWCLGSAYGGSMLAPVPEWYDLSEGDRSEALHALQNGYVPPLRLKSVRDELIACMYYAPFKDGERPECYADAILSRFEVKRRGE